MSASVYLYDDGFIVTSTYLVNSIVICYSWFISYQNQAIIYTAVLNIFLSKP